MTTGRARVRKLPTHPPAADRLKFIRSCVDSTLDLVDLWADDVQNVRALHTLRDMCDRFAVDLTAPLAWACHHQRDRTLQLCHDFVDHYSEERIDRFAKEMMGLLPP